jgi:hypothetical protein
MSFFFTAKAGRQQEKATRVGGQFQRLVFEYNATVDEANADIARALTGQKIKDYRRQARAGQSTVQAAVGASGLTSDTFEDIVGETDFNLAADIEAMEVAGMIEQFNLQASAQASRLAGQAAEAGAELTAEAIRTQTQAAVTSDVISTIAILK